jgi:hypothetical protein
MFNFDSVPFFDNHSHLINWAEKDGKLVCMPTVEKATGELLLPFYHGFRDIPPPDGKGKGSCSPELQEHMRNLGVNRLMVHYLSQYLKCEPTLEAVTAARNERTKKDLAAYTKEMYEDQNIIAAVTDLPQPMNDPLLNQCFPLKVLRLFQMDNLINKLLRECTEIDSFMEKYTAAIRKASAEGYIGIKSHVLELVTGDIYEVDKATAAKHYEGAKTVVAGNDPAWAVACHYTGPKSNVTAYDEFYLYVFTQTLLLAREVDITVHMHTGCTGSQAPNGIWKNLDPGRLGVLLKDIKYRYTKLVLLHANMSVNSKGAAVLTHSYPNVWMDFSCALPWTNMNFTQYLEEVLGHAVWDKIMFGTGQHDNPEMAWCAAKLAKSSLAYVLDKAVYMNLISYAHAQELAEMVLYKNAFKLYRL